MNVYLAGRYTRRDELKLHSQELEKHGIHVTSSWLDENLSLTVTLADLSEDFHIQVAHTDLYDIDRADAIVFFSEDPLVGTPRGGRHVEFGYALASRKKLVVIGVRENIFHYLPEVQIFPTLEEFIQAYVVTV